MRKSWRTIAWAGLLVGGAMLLLPQIGHAETLPLPSLQIGTKAAETPAEGIQTLQILMLMTVLSVAPALMILTTAFTRIVVVMGFLRTAIGTQQLPPNQVILGLSLFLTFAIMSPTFKTINDQAVQPYSRGELTQQQALDAGSKPLKAFMLKQTRQADLALMLEISKSPAPNGPEDVAFTTMVPAFVISELKTAFTIGFLLFLPFIVIDMITASTLMSMGMMMVPPTLVALPFKILLFVLVDGWHLIVKSLYQSFV